MTNQQKIQNDLVSKRNQKRRFLERKLAQCEHGTPDPKHPFRHKRMAAHYRAELARLGVQA